MSFISWVRAATILVLWLTPLAASALTLQAPVGGVGVGLPEGRVLCSGVPPGWYPDYSRRQIKPTSDAKPGQVGVVELARTVGACGTAAAEKVTLVITGPLPTFDPASVIASVDAGRLELRGENLEGARVGFRAGEVAGSDVCVNVTKDRGRDVCSLNTDRNLPADPNRIQLRWAPPGGRTDPDVVTFDANGNALSAEQSRLPVARVLVSRMFPVSRTVDVASGEGRVELLHVEAVSSVECGGARCDLAESGVRVRSVPAASVSIDVRVRLLPRVFMSRGDAVEQVVSDAVSVLRCPLTIVSGEPMRNVDDLAVLVKVDKGCARDVERLRWSAGGENAEVARAEIAADGVYVLLAVGRIVGDRLTVVASRPEDGSVLAVASEKTWDAPPIRTSLILPEFGEVDFIPKNRDALLVVSPPLRTGKLVPVAIPGAYGVKRDEVGFHVRGEYTSGGYTTLRFAYRAASVPEAFASTDFAHLTDPVQRPIREANVPVALGASTAGEKPILELLCIRDDGKTHALPPGSSEHIPFKHRDTCRLVIHRERIPAENGEQRITVDVSVGTVAGERTEARQSHSLVVRSGPKPDVIWVRGAIAQFDRITVRVTHVIDETQYLSGTTSRTEIPSAQWNVITESATLKLYATAALPPNLFRFSDDPQDLGTGPLTLNFGMLARVTWLDSEGREGIVGFESGVMALGLATDKETQLALVSGLGVSVPLGNVNQPTQASINIHGWASYTLGNRTGNLTNDLGVVTDKVELSHWAFIFGPSITIGNIGTFL